MLGVTFGRQSCCWIVILCALAVVAICTNAARAQFTCQTPASITVGGVYSGSNAASPGDGLTGLCVPTGNAIWHSFVPDVSGVHTISTCGSAINAVATLYADCGQAPIACDDDTCGDDAVLVVNLTAGQQYLLRVASSGATAGGAYSVLISQPPQSPITGDLCGTGTFLTINSTQTFMNAPTTGTDTSACGTADTSDVFFAFNADTPGTYRVQVCTQAFQPVLSVQSACFSATSTQCDIGTQATPCSGGGSASLSITPATVPSQVLLRVAGVRGSFGPFAVTLYAPSGNDACASARTLVVGTPQVGRTSPIIGTDTTVNCAASSLDVWYTLSPPVTGSYTISTCTAANFDTVLSVHTACPGQPGSGLIACSDNACGTASSVTLTLAAGTPYRIRVAGKGAAPNGQWGDFTILAVQNAPSNDLCGAATTIIEGSVVTGTTAGATGSDLTPGCSDGDTKDLWYVFTPQVSGTYLVHTCGSPTATSVSVFDSCSATTPLACSDSDPTFCGVSAGGRAGVFMISGVSYRIRVATPGGGEGSFRLAVVRQPPLGDACNAPVSLSLGVPVAASFSGATASGVSGCGLASDLDLWFSFTPSVTRHYRVQSCGSALPISLSIYAGSPCVGFSPPLACGGSSPDVCGSSEGSAVHALLVAGQTYWIRAAAQSPFQRAAYITVENDVPTNDRCADATALTLGTVVTGSNIDSTTDGLGACVADGRDVWYSLTPANTGWYRIDTCPANGAGPLNTVLSLHASCAAPSYACVDDSAVLCGSGSTRSALVVRLVAGSPVLIRVAGAGSTQGWFAIQARLVAPPNDTCAQAINVGNGTFEFDTLAATDDAPTITGCTITPALTAFRSDVWFRYTAPQSGTTSVSLCGSTIDTVLAVSTASGGCPTSAYPILACNDDSICAPGSGVLTLQSTVTFGATSGQAYFVRIGSRDGSGGPGFLKIAQGNLCACDFNNSGSVTTQDILDYLNAWFAQISSADFNGSGTVTTQDIIDFLNCFFVRPAGC